MPVEAFRSAIEVELEHAAVTGGDFVTTGRIALDHFREFPDYYDRLKVLEKEADQYWADKVRSSPTLPGCRPHTRAALLAAIVVVLIVVLSAVVLWRQRPPGPRQKILRRGSLWSTLGRFRAMA